MRKQLPALPPANTTAGTSSLLTITGSGFGTGGPTATQYVEFTNATIAGNYTKPLTSDYLSWADNKIVVKVPVESGTGVIRVTNGTTATSVSTLTVNYNINNTVYNGVAYVDKIVNLNNQGGYTFQMSPDFAANADASATFTRALTTWICGTGVNWTIGANTTANIAANDNINSVRFSTAADNYDAGVLGQTTSFFSSKDGVRWEATDIDVTFNKTVSWNFGSGTPTSAQVDFQTVAMHELGHAQMLQHTKDVTDFMYAATANGITIRSLNTNDLNAGNYVMSLSTAAAATYVHAPMTASTTGGCTVPSITSFTPATGTAGTSVTITGTNFTNASAVTFGGTAATSFTVTSPTTINAVVGTGTSGIVAVTTPGGSTTLAGFNYVFSLPPNNFELTITGATCKGSSNGSVNIAAIQTLSYTATITGNGLNTPYTFSNTQLISNLAAGTYSVCITVAGQPNYSQCFTVVITEPKDLSLYTTINPSFNNLTLALSGGSQYNIVLNGTSYATSSNTITLPLNAGSNDLEVSTNLPCQGSIKKVINLSANTIPYPDPFQSALNLNIGNDNISNVTVEIHALSNGKLAYSQQFTNQSGVLQLDVSGLANGLYALKITTDTYEKIYKILKK